MPIPTFKFNNLTRTDLLQFDGVNFVNVPVYAVGKNVMWGPEGVGYNSLIVGDVTKNISLVNHKHTTDDILGLRELINDLGVNSNSGTSIDLSKYLLVSTFIDHLNNIGSAKHVTQAHLDKLNNLNNYWQLDEQGNLYTTYNTYSTQELSAYGAGDGGGGGGGSLVFWGTESNGYVPLSVEGVSKNLALSTHTHTFGSLTSKPNSLSGYGILNAYTKTEVDSLISGSGTPVSWGTTSNNSSPLTVNGVSKTVSLVGHTHSASDITSGVLATARLGSGTASSSNFLRGDGTWAATPNTVYTGTNGITVSGTTISPTYGTAANTIAQGNDSRIINGQTAFDWGNHASAGYALNSVLSGYVTTSRIITAGNGLTGGGTLASDRTITLATPGTLTAATTNGVTASSHTHAITTTSVGAANTIVQTDATGGTKLNNLMVGGDWKIEQIGTELLLKYNNLIAARFLSDGSIVGLGEITAYGASTGGEGVSLLRTGGTMTGNLTMSADIIMNSGKAIGKSNLPLKLLGNALTYNASNVLTEANTANKIEMGNGWTIEQTTASLTIRKDGVIKGTFNA